MKTSFFQKRVGIGLVFGMAFLSACAGPTRRPSDTTSLDAPKSAASAQPQARTAPESRPEKTSFSVFPEQYRTKALQYESQGELRKALRCWTIVSRFLPQDPEVTQKVSDLTAQLRNRAEEHFRKGLSYHQARSLQAARKEFLLALTDDPAHEQAREYLKNRLETENFLEYRVKQGDTLRDIAKKHYKDPEMDFLIAYFNDLGKNLKPAPNTVLKLPVLALTVPREAEPRKASVESKEIKVEAKEVPAEVKETVPNLKDMLSKAHGFFKVRNYRETASMAEEVLEYDPSNREAKDLANASHYQTGKSLTLEKKYQQALEAFNHVDAGYLDVKALATGLRKHLADAHYLRGVRYFTDEEIEKAIQEWEATLSFDPHHLKAKRDVENARSLLQKLKEIK